MIKNKFSLAAVAARLFLAVTTLAASVAWGADATNSIKSVEFSSQAGDKLMVKFTMASPPTVPASFTVNTPPRIALDFPGTTNQTGKNAITVGGGLLRSINVVEVTGRTRVVLNLDKTASYDTRVEGNQLLLTLNGTGPQAATTSNVTTQFAPASQAQTAGIAVRDIDFRRGKNGEGRIVVDLSSPNAGIDIKQQGKNLVIDMLKVRLPRNLERRFDVMDFGTPVQKVEAVSQGGNTRLTIEPKGLWEYSAYQTETQFIVEVKQVVEDPTKLVQGGKVGYKGEKLSLNFQNVDIRTVLQVIAEFTGLNIITSDTVQGNLTLRLKDVPWDQALDIILQSRGLDHRKNGNVLWIAPRDELLAKEKLELESRQQIAELEPIRTETFQLRYHNAEAFNKLLTDDKQKMLSKRGSAVIDPHTNTLFIQDIPSKLEEIRALINTIDVPAKQVMIEARIVVATDTFTKALGARFGIQGQNLKNSTTTGVSGNLENSTSLAGGTSVGVNSTSGLNVNLPLASSAGSLGLTLLNKSNGILVNMELSAMEADGKGKIVSSPRIVTGDQQKAYIEQGTEIPYREASSSGAATTSFKKAVLSLQVTPRITPDGKVLMELSITKDQVANIAGFDVPAIDTKKVETTVLVGNGETAILGGIFELNQTDTTAKVPFLGDVPFLGALFRQTTKTDDKTELLVFITPRVLDETLNLR